MPAAVRGSGELEGQDMGCVRSGNIGCELRWKCQGYERRKRKMGSDEA